MPDRGHVGQRRKPVGQTGLADAQSRAIHRGTRGRVEGDAGRSRQERRPNKPPSSFKPKPQITESGFIPDNRSCNVGCNVCLHPTALKGIHKNNHVMVTVWPRGRWIKSSGILFHGIIVVDDFAEFALVKEVVVNIVRGHVRIL